MTAGLVGVQVVGHGVLRAEEMGHPVGTPFIVIQADSVDEAQMASEDLAEFARIPAAEWHGTWSPRRAFGRYVLERKLFPDPSLVS